MSLRGSTVADFGCGGGVLLDHLRGVAGALIAIEPNSLFGTSLMERGYDWYRSGAAATKAYPEGVDLLFSTQVIEHVDEPYGFMKEAYALLKPGGRAIISTPNREDILMEMLPNEFPRFFYRTQHRWSFHAASLKACAERACLVVLETRHVHRYGIANAMHWLKDIYYAFPFQAGQISSAEFREGSMSTVAISKDDALRPENCEIFEHPDHKAEQTLKKSIHEVKALLALAGVKLNHEFQTEYSHHYGMENFREVGAVLITVVNREYAKKIIVQLPGQRHPLHMHKLKEETFLVVHGELVIELDGDERILRPGDQLTVSVGPKEPKTSSVLT